MSPRRGKKAERSGKNLCQSFIDTITIVVVDIVALIIPVVVVFVVIVVMKHQHGRRRRRRRHSRHPVAFLFHRRQVFDA